MTLAIKNNIIWESTRDNYCYFAPRVTRMSDDGDRLAMLMQEISGSDYYSGLLLAQSSDRGRTWTEPEPIAGEERLDIGNRIQQGMVDAILERHRPTGTVLAIGTTIYYKDGHKLDAHRMSCGIKSLDIEFSRPMTPVYRIMKQDGQWLPGKQYLDLTALPEINASDYAIMSCGGAQKLWIDDDHLLIPLSIGKFGKLTRAATTVLCRFDGHKLIPEMFGALAEAGSDRGLIEPSIARINNHYAMTMRAEDGHGYVAISDDGLAWRDVKAWRWDDGTEPFITGSTQQHWLELSGKTYLVYTRKDKCNDSVFRWRSPLYICEVKQSMELVKKTEQVVFPLVGDAINAPENVPRMGNFWTTALSNNEAIITVGELRPDNNWHGNTLIAHIEG